MFRPVLLLAVVATSAVSSRWSGPAPRGGRLAGSTGCDSTAPKGPVRTMVDTLRLTARPGAGVPMLPQPWIDLTLEEIRARLRVVPPVVLPVFDAVDPDLLNAHAEFRPALANEVRLTVAPSGHVTEAVLVSSSLADAIDAELLHAIATADSAGALLPLPEGMPRHMTVFLSLVTHEPADTVRPPLDHASRDVSALTLPVFGGAINTRPTSGNDGPHYPQREKMSGVEGAVHVEFVVDEHGKALMPTVRLLRFTTDGFARAVYEALGRMRFVPATIDGCPVKQLIRAPFQFQLTH